MRNYVKDSELFHSLTQSDDSDVYGIGWTNSKAISQYNRLYKENVPSELNVDYARFKSFKYNGYSIPYELKVSNGLYTNNDYIIALFPYPHVLSCYVKVMLFDELYSIVDELPFRNIALLNDYLYIYSDNVDILVFSLICLRLMLSSRASMRTMRSDYDIGLTLYTLGKLDIDAYLRLSDFSRLG